jgi:RNA polymerase sigma-70 factor (sigma-E family)
MSISGTSAEFMTAERSLSSAFEQHYVPLVRLCVLLTGRPDIAEDLAQESFVRAAPKLSSLEPSRVGPYLRRVAANTWKNRLRRLTLERRVAFRLRERPDHEESRLEERDAMWQAVIRLPDRQRACLVLRYYENLPEREVASVLGCSVGTVKSSVSRALKRLRKEFGDEA